MATDATISWLDATILGIVEGLTEFLPVSSTGHLILSAEALGLDLDNPGVSAFLIVIQAGALLAVISLYARSVTRMVQGLMGRDPEGLRLVGLLLLAFVPAAIMALLFQDAIKGRLFNRTPVAMALGLGGVAMIVLERYRRRRDGPQGGEGYPEPLSPAEITWRMALAIGLAQCLALWPGTSRSMVTIMAAMLVGLRPHHAAEFSFLLALPTLGAATAYDLLKEGSQILEATGFGELLMGFALSCIVAATAMKYFLHYLTRHGLALFGWYRIALSVAIFIFWST